MTISEFSNGFDTLLSSYSRKGMFGDEGTSYDLVFDEYEKSYFLTQAQEEIVIGLYNGRNPLGESFEETEELRRYLSNLVCEATLDPISSSNGYPIGMNSHSKFFTLPSDLWFITYEAVTVTDSTCPSTSVLDVLPVRQDEYQRIRKNPFRGANSRRALRLDLADGVIEIISKKDVESYYIRYLKSLTPIVLEDLDGDVSVGGEQEKSPCELHESLHQKVLERAVEKALQSKGIAIARQSKQQD